MSDLITDATVETATRANYDAMTWPGAWAELDSDLQESGGERAAMRAALEAVAPLIAAKSLEALAASPVGLMEALQAEDDAQFIGGGAHGAGPIESHGVMIDWLRARADIERGES